MREIKFRAWDLEENVMRYNAEQAYNGHWQMNDVTHFGQLITSKSDKYKVMQYTGLKDRNGREIYEGDYFYVPEDEYESEYKGAIKWYGGYWGFDEFNPDRTLCGSLFLFSYHDSGEVIGNIYENPELLKP